MKHTIKVWDNRYSDKKRGQNKRRSTNDERRITNDERRLPTSQAGTTIKAAVIQGNIAQELKWNPENDEFIKNNLLEFKLLEKKGYFFEQLYVYLIEKSEILKKLENKGIKNIRYFAKGKRGFIFKGDVVAFFD